MKRETQIDRLRTSELVWDFIVVGGGATGLGCAVDAASRGYKVAVLEQDDFAKCTSSRSTKLVHGGVRYLQKGDVMLVLEALRERGRMKANAPHLDWLSPDIYSSRLKSLCKIYSDGQPLFIPETYCQIGRLWYAIGEAGARGAFCFGYEEYYNDPYFAAESRVLAEMMPVLSAGHPMHGFIRIDKREDPDGEDTLTFDGYTFNVHYIDGEKYTHGAIVQTGPDEFIVAGVGAWIDWGENCKIAYCEELRDGQVIQVLNGDETAHHNMLYLRGRLCLEDYTSPDGTVIPAPEYGLSSQRRFRSDAQARFKVSGIYRIKLYRYE